MPSTGQSLSSTCGGERERAFGADQDVREIVLGVLRHELVDVVAADAALDLREALGDLVGLARAQRQQRFRDAAQRQIRRQLGKIGRDRAEMRRPAVRQHRVDRHDVVARDAVAQRARAAGIVAGHAADGGARGGRDVDREPQAVRLELAVQLVQHDAGLDDARLLGHIERDDFVQVLRAVDDERMVDRLAALRGAAAARQHGHAFGLGDLHGLLGLGDGLRHHHAQGDHLVGRGVGRVAARA